jgi:phosphopantothenoylcysteine decarboxylase / phosphopantothenate---cysteine ligase
VERAELYLIAPASANTLAKLAHGLADNLLTAAALAAPCPVAVAPAMNNRMYLHAATQANLACLEQRGVRIIPPGEGELASHGEHGIGRLAEPAQLLEACESLLTPPTLSGLRVLVTAGGTREPIDSVRYLGNRSSGKMGFALAREAARRGAEVTLVAANAALEPPQGARLLPVQTAAEMARACEREFIGADVLLMAAAVADFRPTQTAETKLKKDQGVPLVEVEPTEDILGALTSTRRPGQLVIGFAAEHGRQAVSYGREKLARKGLDAIVINDISLPGVGFDADENQVTVLTAAGAERWVEQTSKEKVAGVVLDVVEELRASSGEEPHGARAGAGSTAGV